jgi:hypothetical protein
MSQHLSNDAGTGRQPGARPHYDRYGLYAVLRYQLRNALQSAPWYLGILAVLLIVGTVLRSTLDQPSEPGYPYLPYGTILANSSSVFLFVMGIILPSYLSLVLKQGATRQQNSIAIIVSCLASSLLFAALSAILALIVDMRLFPNINATPLTVLGWLPLNILSFMLGWLVVTGFLLRHVLTAAGGIIITCAIMPFAGAPWINIVATSDTSGFIHGMSFGLELQFFTPVFCLVVAAILAVVLPMLNRFIKVKV